MVYSDKSMNCADCGQEFIFTAGEQDFYAQRGFTEAPKRCQTCRATRKAQRGSSGGGYSSGGYDDRGGYSSPGTSFGSGGGYSSEGGYSSGGGSSYGRGGGGAGAGRAREMFEAVCADCGKTANVPFRPSGARPVYCSDCFSKRR